MVIGWENKSKRRFLMSCAALPYEPATPASLHLNSLDVYRVARQFTHTTVQARNFMRFACAALETAFPCRRGVPHHVCTGRQCPSRSIPGAARVICNVDIRLILVYSFPESFVIGLRCLSLLLTKAQHTTKYSRWTVMVEFIQWYCLLCSSV